MEGLATRYADELRTHYKDVLARLEDIRRRRVAIDFPPLPPQSDSLTLKTSRSFKPGKYSVTHSSGYTADSSTPSLDVIAVRFS
ncbi:uncharacterized protein TNCV_3629301 [Trichonephila clavipes]|nr:uncharacterized protein TNCV_3629301 [Trichonephila clavipes]